ncbi:MAG: fibronectin type III domain-containing protein, partial [Ilumatobacteraceae bacterium]
MPTQAYRLTIKSADGLSDTLVITSIRGGTNPYIASIPNGDGQEVDLLTGAVRTGAYVVEVVDVVTGSTSEGTLRLVTSQLYDGTESYLLLENGDKILLENGDPIELELNNAEFGRPHLLSRAAFLEMSSDGGSTWEVWQAGYLTSVRQVDAIRYAFTISNTRRVEQNKQIFTWSTDAERTAFPKRGCVFGGPIIGGLGGGTVRAVDSGGWYYRYKATTGSAMPVGGDILAMSYTAVYASGTGYVIGGGAFPPTYARKPYPSDDEKQRTWAALDPHIVTVPGDKSLTGADYDYLKDSEQVYGGPRLTILVTNPATGDAWRGTLRAMYTGGYRGFKFNESMFSGRGYVYVELDEPETSWPTLPSVDTVLSIRAVTTDVSEASPLYIQDHPVEIAKTLYQLANITVDSASVTAVKNAVGLNTLVTYRITQAVTMSQFLETALFGPFGFAARTNASNELEFFVTRQLEAVPPTLTITDDELVGDAPPPIYDLDESTVVTGFTVKQKSLYINNDVEVSKSNPPDGVYVNEQSIDIVSGDTTTYSTRVVTYDLPGMVTDAASFVPTVQDFANAIALEGFDRFGRGAPSMEVQVIRGTAPAAAQVGDLVYLDVSYFPNKNYRIGESSVGARVAQVVRRDEFPEYVSFKLVDAGVYNQPSQAPTITAAVSTTNPSRIASFTITNAATLNNAADMSVAIEYATGASAPAAGVHGVRFRRYRPGQIPTTAVDLPAVVPGSNVYVRARTEQAGLFPSAWTAWETVALSWVVPNNVQVPSNTNETVTVTWALGTPTPNTTDPIDIYIAPGSVAPSDWTTYRVNTLPANSTTTVITGLAPSTAYIVGVAFRDLVSGI